MNSDRSTLAIEVQPVEKSYCSKWQKYPRPATAQEGLEKIQQILAQELICSHDLCAINNIYQATDRAERNSRFQESISNRIIEEIVRKIDEIAESILFPEHLVSLHYLQLFLEKNLNLSSQTLFDRFKGLPSKTAIAKAFPFCHSTVKFREEVALFELHDNPQVEEILTGKIDRYEQILAKKEELKKLQKENFQAHPVYLNKILDKGYMTLYNHLVEIKQKLDLQGAGANSTEVMESIQENMSSTDFATIVLQTKSMIVERVVQLLPQDISEKKVYFLLGATKAGKSTTLCFLRRDEMVLKSSKYFSEYDRKGLIGENDWASCTFLPTLEVVNELVLIDFPGFNDVHGPWISLGIKLALRELTKLLSVAFESKTGALLLTSLSTEEAGASVRALNRCVGHLFTNVQSSCLLGITKYSQNERFARLKEIEKKQFKAPSKLQELEEEVSTYNRMLQKNPDSSQLKKITEKAKEKIKKIEKNKPLLDEEKGEIVEEIESVERRLLEEMSIGRFIALRDFEKQSRWNTIYRELIDAPLESLRVDEYVELTPDEQHLLDSQFKEKLKEELSKVKSSVPEKEFTEDVLRNGLVYAILKGEVGKLFQELDLTLRAEYDRAILDDVLKIYITYAMKSIREMSKEIAQTGQKDLLEDIKSLENYAVKLWSGYENIEIVEDSEELSKTTIKREIEARCSGEIDPFEKSYLLGFLRVIGFEKSFLSVKIKESISKKISIEELAREYQEEIKRFHSILIKLGEVRVMVEKSHQISTVLQMPLSLTSLETLSNSISQKIMRIRELYGEEDWDSSIDFLYERIKSVQNKTGGGLFSPKESSIGLSIVRESSAFSLPRLFGTDLNPAKKNLILLSAILIDPNVFSFFIKETHSPIEFFVNSQGFSLAQMGQAAVYSKSLRFYECGGSGHQQTYSQLKELFGDDFSKISTFFRNLFVYSKGVELDLESSLTRLMLAHSLWPLKSDPHRISILKELK